MARCLKLFPVMIAVFFASLFLLIWLAISLSQAYTYNQKLLEQKLQESPAPDAVFADAIYWSKRGEMQKSQALYVQLIGIEDELLRKSALYNSANLYLRVASNLLDEKGLEAWDQANPLLAMAKEGYREVLRLDPSWREAKYNYQLALRLSPIFEGKYNRKVDEEEQENAEFIEGWPSIPGFPRGMP